jgi:type IV secretory pathway VirB10-like protein
MDSLSGRRLAAVAGLSAIVAMGAMTAACAKEEQKAPETSTTTTTTTATTTTAPSGTGAPATPGEKSINPTGGNLFTPPVQATPAPNVPPGQHPGINGVP